MFKRSIGTWIFIAVVIGLFVTMQSSPAVAQSTAVVRGTVTDPHGAVVPGAKVTIRRQATGIERTVVTDSAGDYQVASLEPGVYGVEVRLEGFRSQVANNVTVDVARTLVQDFQLSVGSIDQQVTVTSESPLIDSGTTSVGQVIDQKTVQEIPLNGRHFVDLGLLIPGSVVPPANGFLTAPLRGQGSFGLVTAGNREDTVNFQINGINLNDQVQNQVTFQPSINTVQEFKVDNSTFSAEYGRSSGAIVNIATRSGANKFHGEGFDFLRNDALDARNFFNFASSSPPPFKRNQFGGNIGGPIIKNKTFFFFSYEALRQRQGLTLNSNTLTDAQRASVTNPTVLKLLPLIPEPTSVDTVILNKIPTKVGRFSGSGTAPVNIDQWTGDVAHTISDNDRLHGYYAFQKDFRGEPSLQGNTLPGFGDTRQSHRQIFTLNESHTFNANLVNEARFGFNRIHITFTPNQLLNPADFGINEGVSTPIGLPQISITGFNFNIGGPAGFPQGRSDTVFVLSDTLSYLRGKHAFKFGGEARRFYNNNFTLDNGTFTFAGPGVDAFIAGNANAFNVTLGDRGSSIVQGSLGLFVMDNYKWRKNVTFEIGLRYDWNMSPTERFNRFVNFDPATDSLLRVGSGLNQSYHTNGKNFQPRIGIVWDPFKDGKTSVRAAYAILTDQPATNVVTGLTANPPLATPLSFSATTAVPTTTFATARTDAAASGLGPTVVNENFDNAYVQSWNLNVQRELKPSLGITVGYFGSKGTHLRILRNINQFIAPNVRPFPALSAGSPILPGNKLGNIFDYDSGGNSSYNALWVEANKRLSRGLQFNASYTWSKSIDYNSLNSPLNENGNRGVTVQNSYDIRNDRGLSDFDARHRFVINTLYELPFHGNRAVEGWQLSAIVQAQSGNPLNIVTSKTVTGLSGELRPNVTGPITILRGVTQWFDGSGLTALDSFGSLGRNVVIGPTFNDTDFSVTKNTKITESTRVQFRAEFFDLFNHANFGQPGRVVGSSNFGAITATRFPTGDSGSSRQIQFALKFMF
jgi:hypothetical protein